MLHNKNWIKLIKYLTLFHIFYKQVLNEYFNIWIFFKKKNLGLESKWINSYNIR